MAAVGRGGRSRAATARARRSASGSRASDSRRARVSRVSTGRSAVRHASAGAIGQDDPTAGRFVPDLGSAVRGAGTAGVRTAG
ncbi:hypothetical protein [Planomonospora algeriensis]